MRLPVSIGRPSPQAQLIAQSIGQAFSVAYQEFLRANGINPEDLSQKEYSDIINTQEMYNDDLIHFSNSENCKEVGARGGGHSWQARRGRAFLVCGPCLRSEHLCGKCGAVVGKKLLTVSLKMTLKMCLLMLLLDVGSAPRGVSGKRAGGILKTGNLGLCPGCWEAAHSEALAGSGGFAQGSLESSSEKRSKSLGVACTLTAWE